MPGSMIERIEVMTNPPPQYANEPGGVINIITKHSGDALGAKADILVSSKEQEVEPNEPSYNF